MFGTLPSGVMPMKSRTVSYSSLEYVIGTTVNEDDCTSAV